MGQQLDVKKVWQLTMPVLPSGRIYETMSLALPLTGANDGKNWEGSPTASEGGRTTPLALSFA
jgi:hypothetical protein